MKIIGELNEQFRLSFKPKELVAKASEASIKRGIWLIARNTLIVGLILLLLFTVLVVPIYLILLKSGNMIPGLFLLILVVLALALIVNILVVLIGQAMVYLLARLLGGTGTFTEQFYLMAIPESIGVFLRPSGPLSLFFNIYLLYVNFIVVQDIHKLDAKKAAIAVMAIPVAFAGLMLLLILI